MIAKLEKEAAREAAKAAQEEAKAEETGSTGTTEVTMPTAQEDITASMEDFLDCRKVSALPMRIIW